ncbi:unnamed protein product, partial [Amoebophrya sp. A25]|eukprot:GSA25T00015323001.1
MSVCRFGSNFFCTIFIIFMSRISIVYFSIDLSSFRILLVVFISSILSPQHLAQVFYYFLTFLYRYITHELLVFFLQHSHTIHLFYRAATAVIFVSSRSYPLQVLVFCFVSESDQILL